MDPTRPPLVLRACTVDFVSGTAHRRDGRVERLAPRELELLGYLADHPERTVTRDELFTRVWGHTRSIVSRAVDTAVRRLREKIEGDPQQPDHLLTAFGEGYRFRLPRVAPEAPDPDPFVGRGEELTGLIRTLRASGATLLLHGPPGVGKTRLASRVAGELRRELRGGSVLVDVTETRDLPQVAQAVAGSLGLESPEAASVTVRRIGEALRRRGPCLVMLDNCEGVSAAVGEALRSWRAAAPDARFLATSRELLPAVDDVVELGPMPLADAVALFEALAQRARPSFRAAEALPVVEALVERLERLPLAIALAAGRAGALSPRAILERLDDRFRLLASRDRVGGRQRTLRAALDSSWDLLGEAERSAFLACSAFRGGFDPDAAQAVVGANAPRLLAALAARSLIEPRGERFGGYAFVREYATARLAAEPAREAEVHRRHAVHFAERCRGLVERRVPCLTADRANLIAATERAVAAGWADTAPPTAIAVLDIVSREGPYELGIELSTLVLSLPSLAVADRIEVALRLCTLEQTSGVGDPLGRVQDVERLARESGDRRLIAMTMGTRGMVVRNRGNPEDAVPFLLEAITLARGEPVDDEILCDGLIDLAHVRRELGHPDLAQAAWEEVLEIAARVPKVRDYAGSTLANLAMIARRRGDHVGARKLYEEALALQIAERDRRGMATAHTGLGNLEVELGNWSAAVARYEEALALTREIGVVELEARLLGNLGISAGGAGDLDGARRYLEAAADLFRRLGEARYAALARGNLGSAELITGNHAAAAEILASAIHDLREFRETDSTAELAAAHAEAVLHLGRLAEARAIVDRAETDARAVGNPLVLAQVLARRGLVEVAEGRDARPALAEAERLAGDVGPRSETRRVIGTLRAALGGPVGTSSSGGRAG